MSQPLRVLVIGDPYMPVSAYAESLAGLDGAVMVTAMQIEDIGSAPPRTESERSLREYAGDPAEVARAAAGQDVLIVHGAPVSSEWIVAGRYEGGITKEEMRPALEKLIAGQPVF